MAIGGVTKQYADVVPANTAYDAFAQAVAAQLLADGLNVVFAPVRDYVDPIADMDPASPAHPTTKGINTFGMPLRWRSRARCFGIKRRLIYPHL